MLTSRHLAVIRAALMFFDEEMSPHGANVSEPYFDELLDPPLAVDETRELRDLVSHCELMYACCDRAPGLLLHPELFSSLDEAELSAMEPGQCVVSVLFFPSAA
ncbi:hypothetical protein SH661x_002906 [Planctomicrobium sp. SH661]|uniref:hypothetical protein n=1 Tax=Planctomicrobium sp. SH661 TaxID=3448124 RepID=UPI003F5B4D6A